MCEGLWGFDNSSISKVSPKVNLSIDNYFFEVNNKILGDMAQSILRYEGFYYILVSGSGFIVKCDLELNEIERYRFEDFGFLNRMSEIKPGILAISDFDKGEVIIFSISGNMQEIKRIKTGPGPEDVEYHDGKLFIANSAKGEIFDREEGARTISVIELETIKELTKIQAEANTVNLLIDNTGNRFFAAYPNFRWRKDSTGGIIEYDLDSFKRLRHWKINCYSDLKIQNNSLYFLNQDGLNTLSLNGLGEIKNVIKNNSDNIWYEFKIIENKIFIFDAKNHTKNGEIRIYNEYFKLEGVYPSGLNPKDIISINF